MGQSNSSQIFNILFADLKAEETFRIVKPLLAHYTSIKTLESILRNDEVWLSNPLFMNDMEEVRFGINEGARLFIDSQELESACGAPHRFSLLKDKFNIYYDSFANDHVIDTYIFCLSQHDEMNTDGLLSMWRGYGGNGSGAAIVIDTAKINFNEKSPFIIAKVQYASTEARIDWIKFKLKEVANLLNDTHINDDELKVLAYIFFERLKIFALFTKHTGFDEEREWRVVYMRTRDTEKSFDPMFDYWIGPRGVEPKLKLKFSRLSDLMASDLSLSKIVRRIILGPSVSSPLAKTMIFKMLDRLQKPELKARVVASSIPYRAADI